MIKHIKRQSNKSIRKTQSVFMRAVVFPAIQEVEQQFARFESLPDMPEIEEAGQVDYMDADFASVWEGR